MRGASPNLQVIGHSHCVSRALETFLHSHRVQGVLKYTPWPRDLGAKSEGINRGRKSKAWLGLL